MKKNGKIVFMFSFYHLVNLDRGEMPEDDYDSIFIAFDDSNGIGIHSTSIEGQRLDDFIKKGKPIHYEEMFDTDQKPSKIVFWGHSKKRGWAERIERSIN